MVFLYDLHVHTSEVSFCGCIAGDEMAELYSEAGYAGIVITDHYFEGFFDSLQGTWQDKLQAYLQGYRAAHRRGQELGLDVLLGLELRFEGTSEDFLIYGVDEEFLLEYPRLDHYGLHNFSRLAKKHNLLVFQAHPFRPGLKVAEPQHLDGIEVFNGNPRHDSRNDLALAYARQHGLLEITCSDAHRHEDVAVAAVELPLRTRTSAELVAQLKSK